MRNFFFFWLATSSLLVSTVAMADKEPCSGFDHWDSRITLTTLENFGFVRKGLTSKEVFVKVLQSKKIADIEAQNGRPDEELFQLVQKMTIKQKDEPDIELIIVGEYSSLECSMSSPAILMIAPTMMPLSPGRPYLKESKELIKRYKEIIRKQCEHSEGLPECE